VLPSEHATMAAPIDVASNLGVSIRRVMTSSSTNGRVQASAYNVTHATPPACTQYGALKVPVSTPASSGIVKLPSISVAVANVRLTVPDTACSGAWITHVGVMG
jgi:hypothetical protein